MDIEFVAVQQLHITEATSFSDPCIPAERSSDDAYSRSIPETQNYKICSSALAGGTICQSMTATETSKHHYFDQDDTKYLVIANVSKKPNMKTLIYSAAAHGFSVVIVGLPNLDINDLHLAEGVIGTVENSSSSRENWRNANSSNVVNINHNDSRANVSHVVETNDIMRVNKVMNENDDDVNKNNDSDDNDNSNNHSDINNIKNNNHNNDKSNNINISSSNSSSSSSSDIIKKHSFCSILRFQTLQELKSFLIMREITLIGIEIMDEGQILNFVDFFRDFYFLFFYFIFYCMI